MSQAKPHEKSWQARISEPTDALAQQFVESISYDWRLYKHDIAGSIAHATMLARVGLISDAERDAIIDGLKSIERDIEAGNFKFDIAYEDIHMAIEAELIKRIGEPGRKLHTGRSRNDQVATDLLVWLNWAACKITSLLGDLCRAFVALAERSKTVVMPSYTHLQRAQPISAGAEALAWCAMFDRDRCRIGNLFEHLDSIPLGSGAIAGTSLALDRVTAIECEGLEPYGGVREHPLDTPVRSSIELTASRDAACDVTFRLAMIAQHLSRWAEQWIIYMSQEFGFIRIADRYTTGSSMMPQKRNPDMLELIRGRCGNVYGDLFALMTILKGLPIGYNRDLQEDKRIVFRAYDTVSSCLTMAAAIVNSAEYVKENIEPTLDRGFLDATSLAEYLVTKGIPFRTAHQIVGTLVKRCEESGRYKLSQLSVDEMNRVVSDVLRSHGREPVVLSDEVYTCLGAHNVVKRYRSAGAAGGKPFEEQLQAWKKRLGM
ncbi:argininosuccinate lyase [Fontivita pretiosa]|uniref:argininosuccinate lyase n=1 Tax=Fontivita pretiosa TaxID=2989684 RepID=UPI003D1767B6